MTAAQEAVAADRTWRRRDRRTTAGLLAGPMLWLLLFFVIPVGFVAAYSFGAVRLFPTDTGIVSLSSWERLLTGGSVYMSLFWNMEVVCEIVGEVTALRCTGSSCKTSSAATSWPSRAGSAARRCAASSPGSSTASAA